MKKTRHHRKKNVYITDAEYRLIRERLTGTGHSFSSFCRDLLASRKLIDHRSIPAEQFRELSAIGNNLNQLARVANQQRGVPSHLPRLLEELRRELEAIREVLHK